MSPRHSVRAIAPDLARLPITFNLGAISLAEGLRAGLSTAVIVAASQWLHWPGLIEAALAALFTCLSDVGGSLRRRAPAQISLSVLGALIVIAGGLARGLGPAAALPFAVLVIFAGTFARIYGQAAQQVGTLLCIVLVLSLDHAQPSLASAATLGGMFFVGGVWATLVTLVIWRVHPYRPARQAVAKVYQALALLTGDLREVAGPATADADDWDRHVRVHRRAVREAIEAARAVVLDTVRSRGPTSTRAAQSVMRLEAADQLFSALIALGALLETAPAADRAIVAPGLRRLRPVLITLGQSVLNEDDEADARIARSIAALTRDAERLAPDTPLRRLAEAIIERVQVAYTLDMTRASISGVGDDEDQPEPLWRRIVEPIAANLNWGSLVFRHAVRATVTAAPAIVFTLIWFSPYDHWLTITIISTMQPYFGNTFTRALERAGGTLTGGVVAALLGMVVTTPLAIAVAMFPLAVVALAVRSVSFGLYMAALTPMIVLLVELGQPHTSEWVIAGLRALLTCAGCVVALAGCYLLWPSWEPDRLAAEVRAAIAAHGRYAQAVFSHLLKEADVAEVDRVRRLAGLGANNAEASISRALVEPGRGAHDRLEAAMVIDAALRRFAGRLSAIQHDPALAEAFSTECWRLWRDWIAGAMQTLASGTGVLAPRPPLPAGPRADTLGRLGRQIDLMAGTLERIEAGR